MIRSNCNGVITSRHTKEGLAIAYRDLADKARKADNMEEYYRYDQYREHYERQE